LRGTEIIPLTSQFPFRDNGWTHALARDNDVLPMKPVLVIGCLSIALGPIVAQNRLVPEPGFFADNDEYHAKLRVVFAETLKGPNRVQTLIVPSSLPEQVVGIRTKGKGSYEVFVVTPSSSVWRTHYIWLTEYSIKGAEENHDEFSASSLRKDLEEMKRTLPNDIREITTTTEARPIPDGLVERIVKVWERMLLDARHPKPDNTIRLDGTNYHFAMFTRKLGLVSAQTWSPNEGSKADAFVDITGALAEYARGNLDAVVLSKWVKQLE
jgi:hypothetical protein